MNNEIDFGIILYIGLFTCAIGAIIGFLICLFMFWKGWLQIDLVMTERKKGNQND
jgi:hypothetical protein